MIILIPFHMFFTMLAMSLFIYYLFLIECHVSFYIYIQCRTILNPYIAMHKTNHSCSKNLLLVAQRGVDFCSKHLHWTNITVCTQLVIISLVRGHFPLKLTVCVSVVGLANTCHVSGDSLPHHELSAYWATDVMDLTNVELSYCFN